MGETKVHHGLRQGIFILAHGSTMALEAQRTESQKSKSGRDFRRSI